MCAPGLADDLEHAQRIAADPAVAKLILGLGTGKGLHGVGLTVLTPSSIISRTPIRHLSDFQGKKLRIFASDFQSVALKRLGATPVAMTLGDVLPAIQQGTIDGAIAALNVYVPMHYVDAAKYVTQTNQPMIFSVIEISQAVSGYRFRENFFVAAPDFFRMSLDLGASCYLRKPFGASELIEAVERYCLLFPLDMMERLTVAMGAAWRVSSRLLVLSAEQK